MTNRAVGGTGGKLEILVITDVLILEAVPARGTY